ncbi:MAG TPA: HlyD family efflux transporter periplasmic adaptor subunit [Kofleriaceae bacterium]|nr:HlyD family efflux transporter periplasmic adaptor subunit [Kofleriaceae bacterium]
MKRVLLALAAFVALGACNREHGDLALVDVKKADLVVGVEVNGELAAVDSLDVKPPALYDTWDFKIADLIAEGKEVKEGDPIVAFDPSEQMRTLESLANDADAAKKKLDKKRDDAALARRDEQLQIAQAEATLRKASLKTSADKDLVATVDQKVLEIDGALAKLALDQAKNKAERAAKSDTAEIKSLADHHEYLAGRVQELQQNIEKMAVKAPRAGTIVYPTNWRGEKKKVGDSCWRMEAVLQIVGLGKMVGNGEIDEIDVARVKDNQPVSIKLDALPDVQLKGTVQEIAKSVAPKSEADRSNIAKLKIKVDAPATVPLRPGMRFRGEVETERLANVVQVPADAVFVTPDGPVAYKSTGDGVTKVKLVLGKRNASAIEVKSGLAPGDRVSRIDPDRSAP